MQPVYLRNNMKYMNALIIAIIIKKRWTVSLPPLLQINADNQRPLIVTIHDTILCPHNTLLNSNAYVHYSQNTPCKCGVSATRWRRLKTIRFPVVWGWRAAKRHHRARMTGCPGARASSAAETRKVEITESSANSSRRGWRTSPESDSESELGPIHQQISLLEKRQIYEWLEKFFASLVLRDGFVQCIWNLLMEQKS